MLNDVSNNLIKYAQKTTKTIGTNAEKKWKLNLLYGPNLSLINSSVIPLTYTIVGQTQSKDVGLNSGTVQVKVANKTYACWSNNDKLALIDRVSKELGIDLDFK